MTYPFALIAVKALGIIKSKLIDPNGNLSNWTRGDPCTSNWTGVGCHRRTLVDGYLHVQELYDLVPVLYYSFFPFVINMHMFRFVDSYSTYVVFVC